MYQAVHRGNYYTLVGKGEKQCSNRKHNTNLKSASLRHFSLLRDPLTGEAKKREAIVKVLS